MEKSKINNLGVLQQKIGSGFSESSTAKEVINGINLTGKVAIVTGGNTGIGLETTKTLAAAGATVIVGARNIDKAKKNLAAVANVEVAPLDLMDPDSINHFADRYLATGRPLHLLINNAGIMFVPLRRDSRGNESQLSTNFLAPFQLTAKLWSALKKAGGARVINLSSQGHQFAPFDFEDPNFESRPYESLVGYGGSKTALNLFSLELDNRAKAFNVRAYAVHPGNIMGTELARDASAQILQAIGLTDDQGQLLPAVAASMKNIPQGTATTIWAATSPLLNDLGGVYLEDADVAGLASEDGVSTGVKPYSLDERSAKRLWTLSEKLSGVTFTIR